MFDLRDVEFLDRAGGEILGFREIPCPCEAIGLAVQSPRKRHAIASRRAECDLLLGLGQLGADVAAN